jgi:hypothetical protein
VRHLLACLLLSQLFGCIEQLPEASTLPLEKIRAMIVATCTEPAPPQCEGVVDAFNELVEP